MAAPAGAVHKAGRATWGGYERRYTAEMRDQWRRDPDVCLALVEQATAGDATLVCYERGGEVTVRCHRRLLKGMLLTVAERVGAEIAPSAHAMR